ncbi:MAG: VWA domain-containing protein [Acidobacteria bacterium]|nr:VWA domain-containing protein [Candidatus Sulfomarinibacter kjeldsenii]
MGRISRRSIGVFMAVAMATSWAVTQENDQPLAMFFAPVDVPLVSVEVYVSDRSGHPVRGLTLDDFEIFEDGKKVEISHFYASPGVSAAPQEEGEQQEEQEVETSDVDFVEAGPAQDLYLVIYFDDTNLYRGRRQAAIEYLGDFLSAELPPDLKVMLVRYDGRNHIEQGFTEETDEVLAALETIRDAASLSRRIDETMLVREIELAAAVGANSGDMSMDVLEQSGRTLWQSIETFADQTVHRTRTSIENEKRIISSLSGLNGRKAILLVTDGVEARPGEALYAAWGQVFGVVPEFRIDAQRAFLQASRNDLSNEFDGLAQFANGHRVTFYTLSAAGAGLARSISAETKLMDEDRLAITQGMSAEVLMANMAGTTGGRPLQNSSALAAQLDEVSQELASYYSLAFEPYHLGDGKYHRLKVKTNREGVRLRHRDGYLDVPEAERINNKTLAAAIHGVSDNPLGISVATSGDFIKRDDGTFLLPVIITVPIGQLVLIPSVDEHQGRISIHLTVRDLRGDLSPTVRREYPITIPNDLLAGALGQSAGFTMRLAVRPGRQRVAVGLRDEVARTESVTYVEVDVGDAAGTDG